ncbi:MAG: sigma-70 family RNA polymerase sigma factor [Planctomycetota bacterium]
MTEDNVRNSRDSDSTSLSLLQRVRKNEKEAWESLVQLYAPLIYARCRRQFNLSEPDSENVGQEVFVAVTRKIGEFERQRSGSFRSWLRTIVDNKCRDFLRKKIVAPPVGGSEAKKYYDNLPALFDTADSVADTSERKTLLRQAVKQVENEFSDRDWKIFWAVAAEERNSQTVADEFEVTINVVYLVVSRIRARLKAIFQDLLDDSDFGPELPDS